MKSLEGIKKMNDEAVEREEAQRLADKHRAERRQLAKEQQAKREPLIFGLISTGLVHSPGLMGYLKAMFDGGDEEQAMYIFTETYGEAPAQAALQYFKGADNALLSEDGETLLLTELEG